MIFRLSEWLSQQGRICLLKVFFLTEELLWGGGVAKVSLCFNLYV